MSRGARSIKSKKSKHRSVLSIGSRTEGGVNYESPHSDNSESRRRSVSDVPNNLSPHKESSLGRPLDVVIDSNEQTLSHITHKRSSHDFTFQRKRESNNSDRSSNLQSRLPQSVLSNVAKLRARMHQT